MRALASSGQAPRPASRGVREVAPPAAIRWPSFLALSLTALVFLFISGPYDLELTARGEASIESQLTETNSRVERGSTSRQAALLTLGVVALLAFARRTKGSLTLRGLSAVAGVALVVWMVASIAWSDDPFLSIKRVTAAVVMCLLALALARGFTDREMLLFPIVTLGPMVALGVVAELWLGTFRPTDGAYRFSGTLHPNIMTYHCSLLAIALIAWAREFPRLRMACWGMVALAIGLLVLTKSRTGFAAVALAIAVDFALSTSRPTKIVLTGALVALVAGGLIVEPNVLSWFGKAALLGRPESDVGNLTGRTELWATLWSIGMNRPWTGFGFGAFWSWRNILEVSEAVKWVPVQAHSTFLELMLNLGVVGLAAYLVLHGGVMARALRTALNRRGSAMALFVVGVLVSMHLHTVTEIVLFRDNLGVLLFLMVVARVGYVRWSGATREANKAEAETPRRFGSGGRTEQPGRRSLTATGVET